MQPESGEGALLASRAGRAEVADGAEPRARAKSRQGKRIAILREVAKAAEDWPELFVSFVAFSEDSGGSNRGAA